MKFNKFEIQRKIFHILIGLLIAALVYFGILRWYIAFIILIIGVIISIIYTQKKIEWLEWFLNTFERSKYLKAFPGRGVIFLFLAITILLIFFSKQFTLASIMIWTFGDSISALVGVHYGSRKNPFNDRKLIEGTIAGIIVGAIAASFFVGIIYAVIASLIAMILESLEIKYKNDIIDDNLLVPVAAAVTMLILSKLFAA